MDPMTTAEVARRLGVKPETVYAYVSRGLLRSQRNGDGRGSLFDPADVEALAAGGRRGVHARETLAIQTGITLIEDGRLFYRGHDACELATAEPYESVVRLLWTGEPGPMTLTAPPELRTLAEAVTAPLPASARRSDRLRLIVAAAAAADPFRFDTAPDAVVDTGARLLATMVEALPSRSHGSPTESLAGRLWRRLTPVPPDQGGVTALNAALILLADHDLAASTLAARVAASTRAQPYAVVGAGLAALDGPLHGGASVGAYQVLIEAVTNGEPMRALSDRMRSGTAIPGFGHRLYPDGDPRANMLLRLLSERHGDEAIHAAMGQLSTAMASHSGKSPNIDF
ncbi:MAG TPA: citrate/2-methylcitrate synthase, partial [Micromonosporaceae bacterium]